MPLSMTRPRRRLLSSLALVVLAAIPHAPALAQSYAPARPVRFIVPFPPGGAIDALARQQPGKLGYASAGSGTTLHISCELFKRIAGVDLLHVPYKGSVPALTDVLAGQVPVMCDSITSALPHLRSGKLRALGITSARRSSLLPAVPTLAEAGLKDYEMNPWFGVFAPAGTPATTVAQVNQDIQQMLALPAIRARLADIGAEPMAATPEQFATQVRLDLERWGRLVREMGITAD